jgi:hypothetical protein
MEYLVYIIIGLYVWEMYLESHWYNLYYNCISFYTLHGPSSLKEIPSWLKRRVWVWIRSKI